MENNPIIYGLEFQARCLASQQSETDEIRFFIATQNLHSSRVNQVHLIQLDEDSNKIDPRILSHPLGEVWKLNSSFHDPKIIASVFNNTQKREILMQTAILRLPDSMELDDPSKEFLEFQDTEILNTESYGSEIKTTEFNSNNPNLLASVIDSKIVIFNRAEAKSVVIAEISGKNTSKFTGGKWSPHHQGNQFIALYETSVKSYDIRDKKECWNIPEAHTQMVRDIDLNPNRQTVASVGDDSALKIFDVRNLKEPVFCRKDHHHWIWSVKFNTFHDQLILTSGSDCKVMLTCANSCSSEAIQTQSKEKLSENLEENEDDFQTKQNGLEDGLLQTFENHEDSVYCVDWSSADPWTFASLSYDGRLIISKIPKQYKYRILL